MVDNGFHAKSTGQEVAAALKDRIVGKTVLITGTNPRGLGAATARAIASERPALIILTYRTKSKVDEVVQSLQKDFPEVPIQTLELDLESPESIRKAANELNGSISHLDILINNAGQMSVQERTLTAQGIEYHFAVNHLGHFLFTNLILPKIISAAKKNEPGATRIVNLSAGWHQFSPVRFDDFNFSGNPIPDEQQPNKEYLAKFGHNTEALYIPEVGYAQSKTANILFGVYLTEHLYGKGILSTAVHPGGIYTEILRNLPQETVDRIVGLGLEEKNVDQGASSILYAAFDPSITADSEPYVEHCVPSPPKSWAKDKKQAERLWHLSEDLVGEKFPLDFD